MMIPASTPTTIPAIAPGDSPELTAATAAPVVLDAGAVAAAVLAATNDCVVVGVTMDVMVVTTFEVGRNGAEYMVVTEV
jgi:hypothetical protein